MSVEETMVELDEEEIEETSEEELVVVEEQPEQEEEDEPIQQEETVDEVDDEREAIRERRRKEKAERKARRETAMKRDKTELDFLRSRNDDLERRLTAQEKKSTQVEVSNFDQRIAQAQKEAEMADRVIAKAVEDGNGADVAKAMKYRDVALAKMQQLNQQKQHTAKQAEQPTTVDEQTMYHAKQFMDENPWYDSQGRDEDSAIVMAIDQALTREGFNPRSEDYWDELRVRAARRIPERFDEEVAPKKTVRKARGGPAVGSGKEHAPASTRKEVYISPERKQALMDAGVWDDPVLRMKYVKRYAEYDKENA
jgi:hypothetical protein